MHEWMILPFLVISDELCTHTKLWEQNRFNLIFRLAHFFPFANAWGYQFTVAFLSTFPTFLMKSQCRYFSVYFRVWRRADLTVSTLQSWLAKRFAMLWPHLKHEIKPSCHESHQHFLSNDFFPIIHVSSSAQVSKAVWFLSHNHLNN